MAVVSQVWEEEERKRAEECLRTNNERKLKADTSAILISKLQEKSINF